jgi:hypothetical protein
VSESVLWGVIRLDSRRLSGAVKAEGAPVMGDALGQIVRAFVIDVGEFPFPAQAA